MAVSGLARQKSDPRVTDALIRALKDRSSDVRRNAAIALGKLGGRRAIEPLEAALLSGYARNNLVFARYLQTALGKLRRAKRPRDTPAPSSPVTPPAWQGSNGE